MIINNCFFFCYNLSGKNAHNSLILKYGGADLDECYIVQKQQESVRNQNMNPNCCYNIPARVVLYFLSWSGFLVSFMMRNDVSIIIDNKNV